MNCAVDHQIPGTVIDLEGSKRYAVFAFLDQHLSDMMVLFIYTVMLECGLIHGPIASDVERLKPRAVIPQT